MLYVMRFADFMTKGIVAKRLILFSLQNCLLHSDAHVKFHTTGVFQALHIHVGVFNGMYFFHKSLKFFTFSMPFRF